LSEDWPVPVDARRWHSRSTSSRTGGGLGELPRPHSAEVSVDAVEGRCLTMSEAEDRGLDAALGEHGQHRSEAEGLVIGVSNDGKDATVAPQ
jgi:hypothetical protein